MSKPSAIYKEFSRELLENFLWQLQNTGSDYEGRINSGTEPGSDQALAYSFECPSEQEAQSLSDYIHEQAEDEISIEADAEACILRGQSAAFSFDLPTIMQWVGYMCDAGAQFKCRFDGWSVGEPKGADDETSSDPQTPEDKVRAVAEALGMTAQLPADASDYPHMVIARILDPVMPIDRGEKYEDPLSAALQERGLGEVTGGGSQLSAQFQIEFVDLEIHLANLDDALELTRQTLRQLGVPKGSELQFSRECTLPIYE